MKYITLIAGFCLLVSGCSTIPVVSKSRLGNLEINVRTLDKTPTANAEVFIDGFYIGNPSKELPVIHAKRGIRLIRIELIDFKTFEKSITILGDPNHQVLNVVLEKQGQPVKELDVLSPIYTCSMHPQIKLPKLGKCPICFMDLTEMQE